VKKEDVWVGLRPVSPDGLPYIGRPAAFSNLTVATGHAMMGMSLGPATGKLVAEIVADEKPELDLTLVSPDRFSLGTQKSFSQTKGHHQ
jgi:D-amino-acid dehydrogenase